MSLNKPTGSALPGNRRAPVHNPEYGQVSPEQSLHQARHHQVRPAAPRLPASVASWSADVTTARSESRSFLRTSGGSPFTASTPTIETLGSRRVRVGRRALAWRERRTVRYGLARGLLLGSLVRVQVAEEARLHQPPGIEVFDLEAGEFRARSFPRVVLGALGDLAQVAEGAAGLGGDRGQFVRPEHDQRDHRENQQLGEGQVEHRSALSRAAGRQRGQLVVG